MRVLHGPLLAVRNALIGTVGWIVSRQLDLTKTDAIPPGRFEDIAKASISLVTEGFFEAIKDGSIKLKRDTEIVSLLIKDGQPSMELSNGEILPADIISCGTGFHQRVPFLSQEEVISKCTDKNDNFTLYRFINPPETKNLFFIGYNSSLSVSLEALDQ